MKFLEWLDNFVSLLWTLFYRYGDKSQFKDFKSGEEK